MSAQELAERLYRMFKGVPGFSENDALELIEDAMRAHGYAPTDSVPQDEVKLVLLFAQKEGALQIAFSVAHYFKFTDGEESVDKSMVARNYRELAKDIQEEYDEEKARLLGSSFRVMKRLDRPITMPPRERRFKWRRF